MSAAALSCHTGCCSALPIGRCIVMMFRELHLSSTAMPRYQDGT